MNVQKTKYREDITCLGVDMNFILECSTWEDKIHIQKGAVIFCLLYKHTNDDFGDFPKICDHFPNISEDFPKLLWRLDKGFRTFSDDCQRYLKISEAGPMMFRPYNNTSGHFLRDYVAIAIMAILRIVTKTCYFHVWRYYVIFTCEDIICLCMKAHLVFDWCLYNKPYIVHWPSLVMLVVLVSNEYLQRASFTTILAAFLNVLGVSTLPLKSSSPSDNLNYCPNTRDHRLQETVL